MTSKIGRPNGDQKDTRQALINAVRQSFKQKALQKSYHLYTCYRINLNMICRSTGASLELQTPRNLCLGRHFR